MVNKDKLVVIMCEAGRLGKAFIWACNKDKTKVLLWISAKMKHGN